MNAVVINKRNEIIGAIAADASVKEVEFAGAIALGGDPVNVKTFRVSRSKANMARAAKMDFDALHLARHEKNGRVFYTA